MRTSRRCGESSANRSTAPRSINGSTRATDRRTDRPISGTTRDTRSRRRTTPGRPTRPVRYARSCIQPTRTPSWRAAGTMARRPRLPRRCRRVPEISRRAAPDFELVFPAPRVFLLVTLWSVYVTVPLAWADLDGYRLCGRVGGGPSARACPGARPRQPRYDLRPMYGLFRVRQWRVAHADDNSRGLFVIRNVAGAGRSQ